MSSASRHLRVIAGLPLLSVILLLSTTYAACTSSVVKEASENPSISSGTPSLSPWMRLRRPIRLGRLASEPGSCPKTTARRINTGHATGFALGPGPAFPILVTNGEGDAPFDGTGRAHFSRLPPIGSWSQIKTLWTIDPSFAGPVLVRGRRIAGDGEVRFVVEGFGSVGGAQSSVDGHHVGTELQLDEGFTTPAGWREFPGGTLLPGPGCYGFQVDGQHFSYAVVFGAGP